MACYAPRQRVIVRLTPSSGHANLPPVPIELYLMIEQETEHGVRLIVEHREGQACTEREMIAHRELQKTLADFALKIHARSAEGEQGRN